MKKVLILILVLCFLFCSCQSEKEDPDWVLPYTLIWEGESYTHYDGGVFNEDLSKYSVGEVTAAADIPEKNGESNFVKPGAEIADFYGKILLKGEKGWYVMDFSDEEKTEPDLPKMLNHKDKIYLWTGEAVDYTPADEEICKCWSLVDIKAFPTRWGETNFPEIHNREYVLKDGDILVSVGEQWYLMKEI